MISFSHIALGIGRPWHGSPIFVGPKFTCMQRNVSAELELHSWRLLTVHVNVVAAGHEQCVSDDDSNIMPQPVRSETGNPRPVRIIPIIILTPVSL